MDHCNLSRSAYIFIDEAEAEVSRQGFQHTFSDFQFGQIIQKRYRNKSNILVKYKGSFRHSKTRHRTLMVDVSQGKEEKGKYHAARLKLSRVETLTIFFVSKFYELGSLTGLATFETTLTLLAMMPLLDTFHWSIENCRCRRFKQSHVGYDVIAPKPSTLMRKVV